MQANVAVERLGSDHGKMSGCQLIAKTDMPSNANRMAVCISMIERPNQP